MTNNTAPAITSDVAVANVYATLDTAFQMWGGAYLATRNDVLAGHTHKEISAAWKGLGNPGIPTSVAMVASFSAASFLTETGLYPNAWRLAFKGKENEAGDVVSDYAGEIEPAHRVIERARKANGIDYVNEAITGMMTELEVISRPSSFDDEGKRDAASLWCVFNAVADIKALATKFPKDDDGSGEESGEESGEDESTDESTPDDRAASVIAVLTALVNGGIPASEPMNFEIARLAKAYFAMCAPAKAAKSA
jgi:hypothetical protein